MNDQNARQSGLCGHCGDRLEVDARYCGACGGAVADEPDCGTAASDHRPRRRIAGPIAALLVLAIVGVAVPMILCVWDSNQDPAKTPAADRDEQRVTHMNQISRAQESCRRDSRCVGPELYEGSVRWPTYIANYLAPVPNDPLHPERSYVWLDNTTFLNGYCAYAELEAVDGQFVIADPRGVRLSAVEPQRVNVAGNCADANGEAIG